MPPLRRDSIGEEFRSRFAFIHHFAAQATGFRTNLNDMIRRRDDIFVMLHDHNRVAQVA